MGEVLEACWLHSWVHNEVYSICDVAAEASLEILDRKDVYVVVD
jgi:hypothetical protein